MLVRVKKTFSAKIVGKRSNGGDECDGRTDGGQASHFNCWQHFGDVTGRKEREGREDWEDRRRCRAVKGGAISDGRGD